MRRLLPWDAAVEITFEAEPGTLTDHKLAAIRAMGVTRLSLGIEHFDDHILEVNGRAHRSREILRAYQYAREIGFPQINVDLIAGMVEETEEKWLETVARTVALRPDSVTIYQMEVPYNTGIYRQMKAEGRLVAPVADWETKRRWVDHAYREFERIGYTVTSGTTVVRDPEQVKFVYRDGLFSGADILSIGVASFGHLNGVHYQNHHDFDPYVAAVNAGRLPVHRAYVPDATEQLIREFMLQLKLGRVQASAFLRKFGRDPREVFAAPSPTSKRRASSRSRATASASTGKDCCRWTASSMSSSSRITGRVAMREGHSRRNPKRSRRAFLGATVGASLVSLAPRLVAADEAVVMTVTGAVSPSDLGRTLVHEHVVVDFAGAALDSRNGPMRTRCSRRRFRTSGASATAASPPWWNAPPIHRAPAGPSPAFGEGLGGPDRHQHRLVCRGGSQIPAGGGCTAGR